MVVHYLSVVMLSTWNNVSNIKELS